MILDLFIHETDDPQFLELTKRIINGRLTARFPSEIYIVRIDNWFDHKWLAFSGIGRVGFFLDFRPEKDTALDEFSQDKMTRPPFNPNRVIAESYFLRDNAGNFKASLAVPVVHQRKFARSAENLHKRIAQISESAIFVWLSANTKSNGRGSLMVYEVNGAEVHAWYASLLKDRGWRVHQTKGIAREQIA